jgi:uncharacterized protein involved in exopolysaccharide biosynthesis
MWFGLASSAIAIAGWFVDGRAKHQVVLTLEYNPRRVALVAGATSSSRSQVVREFLETQALIVTSNVVCARAVDGVSGLVHGFKVDGDTTRERLTRQVCESLNAQRLGESLVLELRYFDDDLERAKLVVEGVADAYVRRTLAGEVDISYSFRQWTNELEGFDADLGQQERDLAAFAQEHRIASLDTEQALATSALRAYTAALTETRIQRVRASAKVAQLESALARHSLQKQQLDDTALNALRLHIHQLEAERQRLALSSDGHHLRLPAIQAELADARAEFEQGLQAVVDSARSDLSSLEKQERDLQRALEQTESAALSFAALQVEHSRLERAVVRTQAVRKALLGRAEKTGSAPLVDGWLVRVLSPAHPATRLPIGPFVYGLCCLCGLASFIGRAPPSNAANPQEKV